MPLVLLSSQTLILPWHYRATLLLLDVDIMVPLQLFALDVGDETVGKARLSNFYHYPTITALEEGQNCLQGIGPSHICMGISPCAGTTTSTRKFFR